MKSGQWTVATKKTQANAGAFLSVHYSLYTVHSLFNRHRAILWCGLVSFLVAPKRNE